MLKTNYYPKMKKKNLFIFFICFVFVAPFSFTQTNNFYQKQLIGKWKSIRNKEKGVEINIRFNSDGTVKYNVSVKLKGNYILKGNKLISFFNDLKTNKVEVDTSIIEFKGNTLVLKSTVNGTKIKMKRLGKQNKAGKTIFGKWKSENYNGYKAITEYNPYYGINVQLLVKSIEGSFTVDKNLLTIFSPTTYRMRMNFKITKNIMTLHNLENGKDLTMVKLRK